MIHDNVVSYGSTLKVAAHLSVGKYLLEKIIENIDRDGDAIALVNGDTGEEIKYTDLLQDAVNLAVGLKLLGVGRGDVVGIYSESRNEIMSFIIGASCCGATVTMFNILHTKDELEHVLHISKPRVMVCSTAALRAHLDVLKASRTIEMLVQINGELLGDGVLSSSEVKGQCDARNYEPEAVCGSTDTAMIFYSSGTTGLPKGVMLTHLNILYAWAVFDTSYVLTNSSRILSILPWYHVFGYFASTTNLLFHNQYIYLSGYKSEKYLRTIQEYRADCLYVVPPIVVFLAKNTLVDQYDVSSVKNLWCGAAPLSSETATEMAKKFPNFTKLVQGYGMTETTLAVLKEVDELEAGPGYLPVPGCLIKVVDINTGEKLGPNQNGEICIKSPSVMKGYVDNEAATRAAFDDEGYLKTGDIGFYDDHSYFSVVDRLKEIIKYKGHQVAPAEVENVILQHDSVADCAVVGKPDDVAGELPAAFVTIKPGALLTEEELLQFTTAKLSPISKLRGGVIFVDAIPKSAAGKILRRMLKERFQDQN